MNTHGWWRRNRLWLALLVPLVLLAVAASSFRLVRLYLPWEWSRPIVAHAPSGTLRQDFLGFDDRRHTREVKVSVLGVAPQTQHGDVKAAPGAQLWWVLVGFEAEPDQVLQSCTVEVLDAAGVRYGHLGGQELVSGQGSPSTALFQTCTPEDAPGPTFQPFTGVFVPSPVERPRSWRMEILYALPQGVEPDAVRIGFDRPEYLVLQVPR